MQPWNVQQKKDEEKKISPTQKLKLAHCRDCDVDYSKVELNRGEMSAFLLLF